MKNALQFEDAEAIKEELNKADLYDVGLRYEWPVNVGVEKAWNPEVDGSFSWGKDSSMAGDKIAMVNIEKC